MHVRKTEGARMKNKKCIVLYGASNSGKSTTWDRVLGYKNDPRLTSGILHLPDGIYNYENLTNKKLKILLIAQSLEESGRVSTCNEQKMERFEDVKKIIINGDFDLLFISVQQRRVKNQHTFKFLMSVFPKDNLSVYKIGEICSSSLPDCDFPVLQLPKVTKEELNTAGKNAEVIVKQIRNIFNT